MRNRVASFVNIGVAVAVTFAAFSARAESSGATPVEVMPSEVHWNSDPRAPGIQTAVLSGDPKHAGLYVLRFRLAQDAKLPPHRHPDTRYVTILTGELYLGFGDTFDVGRMKAYPAGSFIMIPANAPHYAAVKSGEVMEQDCGMGPTGSTPVASATGK